MRAIAIDVITATAMMAIMEIIATIVFPITTDSAITDASADNFSSSR
jgi:hypothetical protein